MTGTPKSPRRRPDPGGRELTGAQGRFGDRLGRLLGDRGEASIQMAIVFPFVILFTIATVQYFVFAHARSAALTAAREGVNAGRSYQSSPGTGAARAQETAARIGGSTLHGPSASTAGSTAETMRVTVSGTALSLLPGVTLSVSQTASGPRERWVAP
ncbi:TadE family protein [Streptomyces microflavus]|uniref:TadE family protein n=1 Tax=Streptomyces microflavus TaxID=1919 RepID=UPI0035D7729E